ncbi:response regulator [Sphingorhabdus pulchriflava]|uniref:histidine kinase n=1 Tax=Sphingorhabdus pulchriflava TaxID=2292257 RepID=A0A371B531_9SPHN|nr:hybrid sensor histidine kinase/response regulator [Sphingorhabdus pulchriflava]RDV02543.1 response regulator [Sphingorhabdus pulchriflava]
MSRQPAKSAASPDLAEEHRAELNQAKVRLWVVLASAVYVILRWVAVDGPIPLPADYAFIILPLPAEVAVRWLLICAGFGAFALLLLLHIQHYRGHFRWRRIGAMIVEYSTYTYILIVGERITMPFFALIVATALSNGMRFGSRYLMIAAIFSQASLAVMLAASPFWRANVSVVLAFSIIAIALPAYAFALLRQTAEARDTAVAAMQAKSRFLAQASHDLRQPIHSIGYYLDILRNTHSKAERHVLLNRIDRALGSVSRLFKSLLDIAHLDSGTIEVRSEDIALQPLLAELVQQNSQIAQWNDVELRSVPTSLNVHADPTLLTTMVQNLLSNAIKYSHGSSVLIGVRRKGPSLAIEVYDQGIGIAEDDLPHIYEEFYRAHVAGDRDAEGVGLGLAIVNRLAQLSGFVLDLRSRRGVGTVAGLYDIPIVTHRVEKKRRVRSDAPQPLSGFRVILIEDDHDVRDATDELLKRWGCHVQSHPGMPTGIETADLIIADFDLGNQLLGTEVIRSIRQDLGQAIPAILLTGHADAKVKKLVDGDDIQIFSKPVQPAKLRSMLSALRIANRDEP